jgi:hypothetical protein
MSDLVQQREYINHEEDFQGNSTDVYYIINKATGRAQGKIELHQVENLAIVQARIPEPNYITAQQVDALVSPRNITLTTTAEGQEPPHERFIGQRIIQGIYCSVFGITLKGFGEIVFAKQEGLLICAKWTKFYYKGGREKGHYCQITYFRQVELANTINTIPNLKFYCLGSEHGRLPPKSHETYSIIRNHTEVLYRISKVEIPPVETSVQVVQDIRNSTTIE